MELLTQSKYRAYRGCPRYFYYRYERGLVPRLSRDGLRRGAAFGTALFLLQQAEESGHLDALQEGGLTLRRAIRETVTAAVEAMYAEIQPESTAHADAMALEEVKVREMAVAYAGRYGIDQRREVVFELPLHNPVTKGHSKTFRRAGKIDGVVVLGNKHARLIEDKFTGQIQKVMIDRLPLDTQITEYVDALAAKGWTAEVEYRHTRFPGINPLAAKEFKTKPNYPGESLDEFAERLEGDVRDRPEFYFDSQQLMFATDQLEEHRNERWRTATEIIRSRRDLRGLPLAQAFPRHSERCTAYGGCEFLPLCTHQEDAEALYVVESDTPELGR